MMPKREIDFSKFKAVIFDMDGTLFRTEPIHLEIVLNLIKKFGIVSSPDAVIIKEVHGLSDPDIHKKFLFDKLSLDEFLNIKNSEFLSRINSLNAAQLEELYIGQAREFLQHLESLQIPMAIVTASETAILDFLLHKFSLDSYFKIKIGRETTFLSKPSASPYFKAMRELQIAPKEVLIFEDSQTGVRAALGSGGKVIRVLEALPQVPDEINVEDLFFTIHNYNELLTTT